MHFIALIIIVLTRIGIIEYFLFAHHNQQKELIQTVIVANTFHMTSSSKSDLCYIG